MKRKLLLLCFLVFCVGLTENFAQRRIPLKNALEKVTQVYGTKFSFEDELLRGKTVNDNVLPADKSKSLELVLKDILYPNKLVFLYVQPNYYTVVADNRKDTNSPISQDPDSFRTITGYVKDTNGEAVIGATVLPVGQSMKTGVSTNSDGQYVLRLREPASALIFSYIGMQSKQVPIAGSDRIDVVLQNDVHMLNEVTVLPISNGYTALPKERITGAATQMTAADIQEVPTINIIDRIEGVMPGVKTDPVTNKISIRGVNSFSGVAPVEPLVVVDGFPMMDIEDRRTNMSERLGNMQGGAILSRFNPEDIESITVLKDAAASSIWGARAANGVIIITTKKGKEGAPSINFSTNISFSAPVSLNKLNKMNAAEYVDFERELKEKGFIRDTYSGPVTSISDPVTLVNNFSGKRPLSEGLEWMFKVDRGIATAVQRDSALAVLSGLDNRDQIEKYLLRSAVSQQYNLSVSGGANKTTYYVSTNYSKDLPVFRGNKGESFFFTSNLNSSLFNDKLSFKAGFNYNYNNSVNNPVAANTLGGGSFALRPYELIKDENGNNIQRDIRFRPENTDYTNSLGFLPWTYNPLDELGATDYNSQAHKLIFNTALETKLAKWASFAVSGSLQRTINDLENIDSRDSYAVRDMINYGTSYNSTTKKLSYGVPLGGIIGLNNLNSWQYNLRTQFNVNYQFNELHRVDFLAGAEIGQSKSRLFASKRYGFDPETYSFATVNPNVPYAVIEGWNQQLGSGESQSRDQDRTLSYYSNAAISFFNNRYVLSGSVRFDDFSLTGASRSQRAQPLWSVGAKWDAKAEGFLDNVNWLSNAAVRLTYGVNGTVPFTATSQTVINLVTDNETGAYAYIDKPGNKQISWEKIKTWNLGLDIGLLTNRVNITFDIYGKRTSDIIYDLPFNPTYGWTLLPFNASSMKGNGYEFSIQSDWIRKSPFKWTSTFNLSYNTNEVTDARLIKSTSFNLVNLSTPMVGMPTDYMYSYRWAGLDANGQSQIYDKNGEIVPSTVGNTKLTADDLVYSGRRTAPYFGGFFNTFSYGNLTLGARISYEFGNVLRRPSTENYPTYLDYYGVIGAESDVAKRWRNPGDELITNVPGLTGISDNSLNRYRRSDLLTISGSHVRLQQITLGYNLPVALLRKTFMKSLSMNASVRNLGILWRKNKDNVDPKYLRTNSYNNLPPSKAYFISLNTSF